MNSNSLRIWRKRLIELGGSEVDELSNNPTHVIAATWDAVVTKWGWHCVNRMLKGQTMKVVDQSWISDCLSQGQLLHTDEYDIVESKKATKSMLKEKKEYEKQKQRRLHPYT